MSSYLEKLRVQIEERLAVPVRFTKDPAFGMFTAVVSAPVGASFDDLPVARMEFLEPVHLNFYLKEGWQQEALRQILKNTSADVCKSHFDDFEVQYTYNRICNQLELLAFLGYTVADAHLNLLTADCEVALMEQLAREPDLPEIAKRFHIFFNTCPIRGETADVAGARMALMKATARIISQHLSL